MTSNVLKIYLITLLMMTATIVVFILDGQTYERKMPLSPSYKVRYTHNEQEYNVTTTGHLPKIAIAPRIWMKYPSVIWKDLQLPLLVSQPMGRLGNVMGEYATLLGLGRVYDATTRLHPAMHEALIDIFPQISMPVIPGGMGGPTWVEISFLTWINYGKAEAAAAGILGPEHFLLKGWPFEIQLFNTFRQDIIKEFTFSSVLQKQVNTFWEDKRKNTSRALIGVHVRRTDYLGFMKQFEAEVPEDAYFRRSTDYYRLKYPDALFLVASDDMDYVKKAFANYADVLFTPGTSMELDMALMASCNHSIITLGSYGFWGAYLAGGEVVYPDIKATEIYTFQRSWYEFGELDFFTPLPPY